MSNSWFQFKQFKIEQSVAAMKVGTDGVLLGAWLRVDSNFERYLDVGTGTGVVALMVAQRINDLSGKTANRLIDAVEIDEDAARQAISNVEASDWARELNVYNESLQAFVLREDKRGIYDHIFTNPPWFVGDLCSPTEKRNMARHTVGLSYEELVNGAVVLLRESGLLSVVLPADNRDIFENIATEKGFVVIRRTLVRTLPGMPPKRVLLELRLAECGGDVQSDELTIETGMAGCYTEEYVNLTKEFYLKF